MKKLNRIFFNLSVLILLFGCNNNSNDSLTILPCLVDSNSSNLPYIYTDTICLGLYKPFGIFDYSTSKIRPITEQNIGIAEKEVDALNIRIFIDTNSIAAVKRNEWTYFYPNLTDSLPPFIDCKCGKNNLNKGYYVYIINRSNQSVNILYKGNLLGFQEAKIQNGIWTPIENEYSIHGSFNQILLTGKQALLTKMNIYEGDTKVKIRLGFRTGQGLIYSNEIDGKINKSQLID